MNDKAAIDMKTCSTCANWKPSNDKVRRWIAIGGWCDCSKITENYGSESYGADALVYSYEESGKFWTGPDFGCVHHSELIK